MIKAKEKQLYDFLNEILKDYKINIYRGVLPSQNFNNRLNDYTNNQNTKGLFPFVLLKPTEYIQNRYNLSGYNAFLNVEIIVGTNSPSDYMKNLEISDYIKRKLLEKIVINNSFGIDQTKDFTIKFLETEQNDFFFSQINFTILIESVGINKSELM